MKSLYRMFLTAALIAVSLFYVHASAECEHSWSYSPADEGGHTASCSLCGETKYQTHSLSSSKTPASCDKPSVITYTCAQCGYSASYPDGEPSANHAWGAFSVTKQATCRQEGTETRVCTVCGAKENHTIEKTEHNYGEWSPHDEKWHIRYCKVCNWAYKGSHRLDDGKLISEATESTLGEIAYTCRVCKDTFSRAVNSDGTILVATPEDVLNNGTKYLLTDTGEENSLASREVKFSGNHLMDITPGENSDVSVYANASGGNYAGLIISGKGSSAEILPAADGDTLSMDFLKLSGNSNLKIRIFNSDGTLAIGNAGGQQLYISQKKADDASSVTLVMRISQEGNHLKGSARLYSSKASDVLMGYGSDEYSCMPSGACTLIGQAVWDYHKTSKKLTVNALNQKEGTDGIVYAVLEDNVRLMTASNIKKAQGIVSTSSASGVWRLRVTFPNGYSLETPGYLLDGTFVHIPGKALMDEEDIQAANAVSSETKEEMPEAAEISSVPEETDPTTESIDVQEPADAPPVLTEKAELVYGTEAAYTSKDLSSLTAVFDGQKLTLNASGLPDGYTFVSAVFVETGSGFRFKITNAYSLPAVYNVPDEEITLSASVVLRDTDGNTRTFDCGEYTVSME